MKIIFLLSAISLSVLAENPQECVTTFNKDTDLFPVKAASNNEFSITYNKYYKVLTNKVSSGTETIVAYQCGTQKPTDVPAGSIFFELPLKTVAVTDTTVVSFLEALGLRSAIKLSSVNEFVTSPCFQSAAIPIIDVVDSKKAAEQYKSVNAVFTFDDPSNNLTNKITFDATIAPSSNERTVWIHYIAALFNKEELAMSVAKKIDDNFKCLQTGAAAAQKTVEGSPLVAWTTYDAPSSFNNNTASYTLSGATYKTDFTKLAGATPLAPAPKTSYKTAAELLVALAAVDIVIDESFTLFKTADDFYNAYGLTSGTSANYKFAKNKQVYQLNLASNSNGGNAWFETAVLFENLVVADIISATHPSLMKDYKISFLRNIYTTPEANVFLAASCKAEDKTQLQVPLVTCPAAPAASSGSSLMVGSSFLLGVASLFLL